jgi:uncharacterized pyridoxamine 5'-phosphate oxidase family protein
MNDDDNLTYDAIADQAAEQATDAATTDDVTAPFDADGTTSADDMATVDMEEEAIPAADVAAVDAATNDVAEAEPLDGAVVGDESATGEAVVEDTGVSEAPEGMEMPESAEASAAPESAEAPAPLVDQATIIERVADLLTGVFYLATEEGDQPRVRPFDSAVVENNTIYMATSRVKPVYAQLAANPKVELFAMNEDGTLRVAGVATENTDAALTKMVLEKAGKYTGDENLVVFGVSGVTGEITGADGKPVDVTL